MNRRFVGVVAAALAISACGPNTVSLRYRFPAGQETRYRWTINATRSIDSPNEQTSRHIQIIVNLTEQVAEGARPGEKLLRLHLNPVRVTEDGQKGPTPGPIRVEYHVDSQGQVAELVKSDLPAGAVSSLELDTLASETRPPLPPNKVQLGENWAAPLAIKTNKSSIGLTGTGSLLGFDLADRRKLARIEIKRSGKISSQQSMGQAELTLEGNTSSRATSAVDMDNGVLFSSTYRSTSRFDLSQSGAPAGRLKIVLTSSLKLQK